MKSITVKIKDGYKQRYVSGIYYHGELFSIEDSGCWVNFDGCLNVCFAYDEIQIPKNILKKDLQDLVNEDCEPDIAKNLIAGLLRGRPRK